MRLIVCALAVAGCALAQSDVKVVRSMLPEKALTFEVTVPATCAAVWQAFTSSDGLSTWLTPGAVVDLREGGEWTAHFPNGGTGGGTIVSFVPQKMLVLAAMAPEQFPHVRAERTTAKFVFEARGESTLIRLVQTGWKEGDEWDRAYEYLAKGNAQMLAAVQRRFVSGPTDWSKEWGAAAKK